MAISVFDLFKIGIGPSSSHTVGPMRAARMFTHRLKNEGKIEATARVLCELYGSLGATGKGHGTGTALLLGLADHEPDTVDPDAIQGMLQRIRDSREIKLLGTYGIAFSEKTDVQYYATKALPFHSNGVTFSALDTAGALLSKHTYYSVGGGFVVSEEVAEDEMRRKQIAPDVTILAHPFHSADELLAIACANKCSITDIMRSNERHWRTDAEIDAGLLRIWNVMQDCVERGCRAEGVLHGPFKVRRRAAALQRV
jgi:L-serine dehydratase